MLKISTIKTQRTQQPPAAVAATVMSCITTAVMLIAWSVYLTGAAQAQELATGTSSRQLRKEVVRGLPYAQLNADTKSKIADILEKPSLYRRLPVTAINVDPEYLQFLIRYPETVVGIWELMGITHMQTQRVAPYTLNTNDGAGTTSNMELVYGSPNLHIYYGDGMYEGPVLRTKLRGKCVIIVRTRPRAEINGGAITPNRPGAPLQTACQLDVFLKLENGTAGIIAKTISPIVGPTADHNFTESLKFVERLNKTTVNNGPGVQQMAERLDIDAHVIKKYQDVVGRVYRQALERTNKSNAAYQFDYSERNQPGFNSSPVNSAPVNSSPVNPSPVKAQPFSSAPAASVSGYPYQQQSYHGNVRSFYSVPSGGSVYDSGSVRRAVFTDQYPR